MSVVRGLIGLLALGGCASAPVAHWVDAALLDDGDVRAVQRLRIERDGGVRELQAVVEAGRGGVTVAVMDVLGRRLLLLQTGPAGYREERDPHLPGEVDGRNILADILLVYWPRAQLETLLPGGLQLQELDGARSLREGQRVLASVTCTAEPWRGRCTVERPAYALTIDSRTEAP